MLDSILKEFEKITFKACERHASSLQDSVTNVQLVLSLNSEGEVEYTICSNYNPDKKISFLEILGVRIDFKGYSMIVPPFIQKTLLRLAEDHQVNPLELSAMIIPTDEIKRTNVIWVYIKGQPKEQIKIEDFFN